MLGYETSLLSVALVEFSLSIKEALLVFIIFFDGDSAPRVVCLMVVFLILWFSFKKLRLYIVFVLSDEMLRKFLV